MSLARETFFNTLPISKNVIFGSGKNHKSGQKQKTLIPDIRQRRIIKYYWIVSKQIKIY